MDFQSKFLSFANLHEAALILDPLNVYEKQDELVAYCRSAGKPFLTTMPVRHRFKCDVCGIEMGEALLCFEDSSQPLQEDIPRGLPYTPSGFICPINLSALHGILAHGKTMLKDLEEILSRVQT